MAAKRKGRNVSGWLIVDKPAGPTSTQVVGLVRAALGARKAGHAGTLDPGATGVLAVALGEATKTVPFVTDARKAYRFTMRLGQGTDTDDADGAVIAESDARPDDDAIAATLPAFTGDIVQVPPRVSAVKVAGERAYDRARAGEDVALAPRPLHVASLELLHREDRDHVTLEMVCGKGGYVRALARDIGQTLGCHAHAASLRRLWSGPFAAEDGLSTERIEALARSPDLDHHLLPLEAGLAGLPELRASPEGAVRLRNGNHAPVPTGEAAYGDTAWASFEGRALAVGTYRAGALHPDRVFNA